MRFTPTRNGSSTPRIFQPWSAIPALSDCTFLPKAAAAGHPFPAAFMHGRRSDLAGLRHPSKSWARLIYRNNA